MNRRVLWIGIKVTIFAMLLVSLLVIVLLPGIWDSRHPRPRFTSRNNLRMIGLALHTYHDTYGVFPPAYVADDGGREKHSWRTMLLPFMENDPLYASYDFSQPWDAAANRACRESPVPDYLTPKNMTQSNWGKTNYFLITGDGTFFVSNRVRSLASQIDDSRLIIMFELPDRSIPWAKPEDISVDELRDYLATNKWPRGGYHVMTLNGGTETLRKRVQFDELSPRLLVEQCRR